MNSHKTQQGQALVLLLVFMIVAITVTTVAIVMTMVNSLTTTRAQEGLITQQMAESGAEEALLGLLRNPSYTGSKTLTIDSGTVTVEVTGSSTKTILSTATYGNYIRKIQVGAAFMSGILNINSWQEVF